MMRILRLLNRDNILMLAVHMAYCALGSDLLRLLLLLLSSKRIRLIPLFILAQFLVR